MPAPTSISEAIAARGAFHHKRKYAYKLGNGPLTIEGPTSGVLKTDDSKMTASAVISTPAIDRGGDLMEPLGCQLENYMLNPLVLLTHGESKFLVGLAEVDGKCMVFPEDRRVWSVCRFQQHTQDALDTYVLVKDNFIRATSIGFAPTKGNPRGEVADPSGDSMELSGYHIKVWDLLEWSWLGGAPPMNPQAIRLGADGEKARKYLDRGYIGERGRQLSPVMQKMLAPRAAQKKGLVVSGFTSKNPSPGGCILINIGSDSDGIQKAKTRLQNKALAVKNRRIKFYKKVDAEFDVQAEVEPRTILYKWISQYLKCRIRDIDKRHTFVPDVRKGSFLSGLAHSTKDFQSDGVRNFGGDGSESPPRREQIQLNSKLDADFLVDGFEFFKSKADDAKRVVINTELVYGGIELTVYTTRENRALNAKVIADSWEWATQNNFLKGEAFALSGDFLKRTDEGWDDVILEEKNKTIVRRTTDQFNAKGLSFVNRGTVMTGPPGVGKTLASRIIRNQAKGTFIWLSSKDFHRYGSVDGMQFAFQLAKELAPAIICLEDCDAWLTETTIDLVKTEMDGVSRSMAVWTIMTTNFPERLPDALIDRPGRFHDILKFDFPSPQARREMLAKWLNGYPPAAIGEAVAQLSGYSGAHVYELAQFAKTLQETDNLPPGEAVLKALEKIKEMREIIDQIQLEGVNYNRRRKSALDKPRRRPHDKTQVKVRPTHRPKVKAMSATTAKPPKNIAAKNLEAWTNLTTVTPKRMDEWQKSLPDRAQWPAESHAKIDLKTKQFMDEGYSAEQAVAIAFHHVKTFKELGTASDAAGGNLGDDKPKEKAGTDVQCVRLAKENYPDEQTAKAYCEKQGYKVDKPSHNETHWGYDQFPKEQMVEGSESKAEMGEGIHAIVGTRNMDAGYGDNIRKDDDAGADLDTDLDADDLDSELEGDEPAEGKASDRFFDVSNDLIQQLADHFESAEATQDHPGILEAAPQWLEGLQAVMDEIGEMQAANAPAEKEKEDKPKEKPDETEEEKKKRMAFRLVWGTGKSMLGTKTETLATLKALYLAENVTPKQKAEIKERYRKLRGGVVTAPVTTTGSPIDSDAIIKALSEQEKKVGKRLETITGGLPSI